MLFVHSVSIYLISALIELSDNIQYQKYAKYIFTGLFESRLLKYTNQEGTVHFSTQLKSQYITHPIKYHDLWLFLYDS